jgi:hypothetical protein
MRVERNQSFPGKAGLRMNQAQGFVVGQTVVNTIGFNAPANIPVGSIGEAVQLYPGEVAVRFPGNKLVRVDYNSLDSYFHS